MGTTFRGTFVISWSQTEVDGLKAATLQTLTTGSVWSWRGEAVRVDGPHGVLSLSGAVGEAESRVRAAKAVRRLVGAAVSGMPGPLENIDADWHEDESSFIVTDGRKTYTVTIIELGESGARLLMFVDDIPPREKDLWIVHHSVSQKELTRNVGDAGGVICFTPGTIIDTLDGRVPVEHLQEGDLVLTKDNGPQEVQWIGRRRMTGARLFAMPQLRPIRIRAESLGVLRPDQELLVSPEHRMLVKGNLAKALFNTPEVLVAASELVNSKDIFVDHALKEVTYIHVLLPQHEVVWANNVETESFHPASASLTALDDADRERLLHWMPQIGQDPNYYGDYARRKLTTAEAAIFGHEAA